MGAVQGPLTSVEMEKAEAMMKGMSSRSGLSVCRYVVVKAHVSGACDSSRGAQDDDARKRSVETRRWRHALDRGAEGVVVLEEVPLGAQLT